MVNSDVTLHSREDLEISSGILSDSPFLEQNLYFMMRFSCIC